MSQFNLSVVASVVSDAASAEAGARDRWVKAGAALAKLGIVSAHLVKATEKKPNELFDADALAQVRGFIVQGVSASKKTLKFSAPHPGAEGVESTGKTSYPWTVAQLLALTPEQLRAIEDDVLKTQRRAYMQLVDGPMISRVRVYVDRANGVKVEKAEKTAKDAGSTTEDPGLVVKVRDFLHRVQGGKVDALPSGPTREATLEAGLAFLACLESVKFKG